MSVKTSHILISVVLTTLSVVSWADDDKDIVPAQMQEQVIDFVYDGVRSYYHCDYVKAETEVILRKLGAHDIFVECSGGLPYSGPNFVQTKFIAHREVVADKSTHMAKRTPVEIKFKSSCDLHATILDAVLVGFSSYELDAAKSCWYSEGNINYKMKVLN